MKCYACGCEEKNSIYVDVPIYYKSGKKKGEIKGIEKKNIGEDISFTEIFIGHEPYCFKNNDEYKHNIKFVSCPKCGTIIATEYGSNFIV